MQVTTVWQRNWEAIHAKNPDDTRKYRYIINKGSSRSSKTFSLIDCYDLYARSQDNKRMTVWRNTKSDCKQTVLKDVEKHFKTTGRFGVAQVFNKTESVFTYATGSTFEIHGTEDIDTVMGLTQEVAWFNEPYKISKEIFDQIDQRTSDFIIIDLNPKMGHWVDDLEKDPRAIVIHSTFRDNPFCPENSRIKILSYQPIKYSDVVVSNLLGENEARKYDIVKNKLRLTTKQINELSRCIQNEYQNSANEFNWLVYGLGLKAEKPNRIFKWTEISDAEYNELDVEVYYGVDWGTVHPWGIVEIKYYDGGLYIRELNYTSENQLREKLSPTERAQINDGDEGFVTWYFAKFSVDVGSTIICDNNRLSKIAALRSMGYNAIPADKRKGTVIDGIDELNTLRVYFTTSSTNVKYEQENYSRKIDRYGVVLEDPEDLDNHLIDPTRYVQSFLRRCGIIRKV